MGSEAVSEKQAAHLKKRQQEVLTANIHHSLSHTFKIKQRITA